MIMEYVTTDTLRNSRECVCQMVKHNESHEVTVGKSPNEGVQIKIAYVPARDGYLFVGSDGEYLAMSNIYYCPYCGERLNAYRDERENRDNILEKVRTGFDVEDNNDNNDLASAAEMLR